MNALILAQLGIAAAMTGIIWLVQLLVYPQFLRVGKTAFVDYHRRHCRAMGFIVAPLMVSELFLSLVSVVYLREMDPFAVLVVASVITVSLWLLTFLVQVPMHKRLESGWSDDVIQRLIRSNWLRTALWSLRLALLFWLALEI